MLHLRGRRGERLCHNMRMPMFCLEVEVEAGARADPGLPVDCVPWFASTAQNGDHHAAYSPERVKKIREDVDTTVPPHNHHPIQPVGDQVGDHGVAVHVGAVDDDFGGHEKKIDLG